jgi:hypothetical protein
MNLNPRTVVLVLPLFLAGCSNESAPSAGVPSFAELDLGNDGFLSRSETIQVPRLAEIFTVADSDQDGRLSVAEFSKATIEGTTVSERTAGGPLFPALDKDRDGMLTLAEADPVPPVHERFTSFDADGNGALSSKEYERALDETIRRE